MIYATNITSYAELFSNELKSLMCNGLSVGGSKCDNKTYGIQDFLYSFSDYVEDDINASIISQQIIERVNSKLNIKASFLINLSRAVTSSCNLYQPNHNISSDIIFNKLYNSGNDNIASNLPNDMQYISVYDRNVSLTSTTVRLPNYQDPQNINIQNDAIISNLITDTMVNIHNTYCIDNEGNIEYCQMYFASLNGIFRQFPAVKSTQNSDGSIPNFDPRLRSWYVAAASGDPHIIVILIDISETMKQNGRISQLKSAVKAVLNILPLSSWLTIVAFNNNVILPCFEMELVQASSRNIEKLRQFVSGLTASGTTNYTKAFNTAFDILDGFDGDSCHSSILFVTDGDDTISSISSDIDNNNIDIDKNIVIFSYGFGNDGNMNIAKEMADITDGIYKTVDDDGQDNLDIEMSLFYLYYAYSESINDNIWITSPYLDFDTGFPMITMTMPIYNDLYLIGIVGVDIPLSYLSLAIGDIVIGRKSYYFVMNQESELILHPNIDIDNEAILVIDDRNNKYVPIYVTDQEPKEFNNIILQSMIRRESGYNKIKAKIRQSAGNVEYNGFIHETANLLYIYAPVGPSSLSIAIVVYTRNDLDAPWVPSPALKSVPQKVCDLNINETLFECQSSFSLYHDLQRMIECNSSWNSESQIINSSNLNKLYSKSDIYGGVEISVKYPMFTLKPGLFNNEYEAIFTEITCDSLDLFHKLVNKMDINISASSDNLPYDGLRSENAENILNSIHILTSLHYFWKQSYLESNSPFFYMYYSTYFGVFINYPAIQYPASYNPVIRPWFQRAASFPDLFVFTTPYNDAATNLLILSGGTVIYAPNSDYSIGITTFDFAYSVFVNFWKEIMKNVCDRNLGQYCYLLDSSAFLLYYDGMENRGNDEDISIKFFGDKEPTLMQSLLDIGFFINDTNINVETDTIDITYIIDEDIYNEYNLNRNPMKFDYNKGTYTVHRIFMTNLWLIHISNYEQIRLYPWDCPHDFFGICNNVYSPGCITTNNINGQCMSATMDVCIKHDSIDKNNYFVQHNKCNKNKKIDLFGICVLESNLNEINICLLNIKNKCDQEIKNLNTINLNILWISISLLFSIFISFLIIYCIYMHYKYKNDKHISIRRMPAMRSTTSCNVIENKDKYNKVPLSRINNNNITSISTPTTPIGQSLDPLDLYTLEPPGYNDNDNQQYID